jgi:hypothetical protein
MVRTLLGDFIQNIQANNVGTLNNGGGTVGDLGFGQPVHALMNGVQIVLNGVPNTIALVTSPTTAVLLNRPGANGSPSRLRSRPATFSPTRRIMSCRRSTWRGASYRQISRSRAIHASRTPSS